jgi:NAD(P)-dependent dehydrogenase (short-subunit alcohol dehydrogenase family)
MPMALTALGRFVVPRAREFIPMAERLEQHTKDMASGRRGWVGGGHQAIEIGIQWRKPMVELPTAEWQRVIDLSLTAAFVVGREAGKRMVARGQANAIAPGSMHTDMNQALMDNPTFDAWVQARAPARRWGEPEELAGVAVFLASRASDDVNGQTLFVDGGLSAVL